MSSFIIKYFTNRILRDNQLNRLGVEDPYHEYEVYETSSGKKTKKVPRKIPQGLSDHDVNVLKQFKKKAHRYDMWFSFLGIKFGWTNVIGLIPIAGTIISTYWSLGLLMLARKLEDGFPLDLQLLFLANIVVDFLLGLIPLVGDIIEIGYKSNSRNYLLLEKHLERVGQKNRGIISEDEVRPGFINDKVQPFVEEKITPFVDETIKPGAVKAGEQILSLIEGKKSDATTSPSTGKKSEFDEDVETVDSSVFSKADHSDKASVRSLSSILAKDKQA